MFKAWPVRSPVGCAHSETREAVDVFHLTGHPDALGRYGLEVTDVTWDYSLGSIIPSGCLVSVAGPGRYCVECGERVGD